MNYSIYEILYSRLIGNKHRLKNELIYEKTIKLLDIWDAQKRVIYLTRSFDNPNYHDESLISESYITLLMENDLIFIEEVQDPVVLLNLIYYWLVANIKKNSQIICS